MRITSWRSKEKVWRLKGDSMFLGNGTPGANHLLDVGCGKGSFMLRMREHGWNVEGSEVDADGVEYARSINGLTVHLGNLENINFPDNTFDVVTSNHVIEHVHDPIALIQECLRILKPGGKLVLATPNMDSFGHRYFERNWTHLDPPRHLRLFTQKTLRECAEKAGFQTMDVWCPPGYAEGAFQASIERKNRLKGVVSETTKSIEAASLKIRAYYRYFIMKEESVGEEVFLMATKNER
jgi:SAM-dependent methyltransferase